MKVYRHLDGTVHASDCADGYAAPDWNLIGELPVGTRAEYVIIEDDQIATDLGPAWSALREERARRLASCDWTQLSDVSEVTQQLWRPYRQALRDLPLASNTPLEVEWPSPPA